MATKKLNKIVIKYYLDGRKDEDFVMEMIQDKLGGTVERGTPTEDKKDHVDIWWYSPRSGKLGIDVKGPKKNKRSDSFYDDNIHWLEIKNVGGKDGWIYGKSDYIAFRTSSKIIFVKREKLISFALECIKDKQIVYENPNEFYIPYVRKDRSDLIVKVKTDDLIKISRFYINY